MTQIVCQGTLVFTDYVTNDFFKNDYNAPKVTMPSFENSDVALLIRGNVLSPLFPDGCRIIINDEINPKNGQWVVLRRESAFCIGIATIDNENRKVTLDYPGRPPLLVPFEEISQLVLIRAVLF